MHQDNFNQAIQEATAFIIGPREILDSTTINFIFNASVRKNIYRYFFISPQENLIEFLEERIDIKEYSIISDFPKFEDVSAYNLIIFGINSNSIPLLRVLEKQKKKKIVIFVQDKIGMIISNFNNQSITIYEQSFGDYAKKNTKLKVEPSSIPIRNENAFFTNRVKELQRIQTFISNPNKRACKIVGMDSIGKSTFFTESIFQLHLDGDSFEFDFSNKINSHITLLEQIFSRFGLQFEIKRLERAIKHKTTESLHYFYSGFFHVFDKIKNAKIIFNKVQYLINPNNGKFYNQDIFFFIQQLLKRDSYNGNRIYFISNQKFLFDSETELFCENIELKGIDSDNIKKILQHEFNQMDEKAFAEEIMRVDENNIPVYDGETIIELTNGNPQIAKMFAKQVIDDGLASLHTYINDADFRKKFDDEKIDFLLRKYNLSESEKRMLNLLCLIKNDFDKFFFKKLSDNPIEDIRNLKDRFLLEVTFYQTSEKYYIPRAVQKCILANIKKDSKEYKDDNLKLGEIYRDLALNLKTSPSEEIEYFNRAEHHFEQANAIEQRSFLIFSRNEIYLNKAEELYRNFDREHAWFYFKELHEKGGIKLSSHQILHYIVCNIKYNNKNTNELYLEAIKEFELDTYLFNSYAHYLFLNHRFNEVVEICESMKNKKIKNEATINILALAIHRIGNQNKALNIIDNQINSYPNDLNNTQKELLINDLMSKHTILAPYTFYQDMVEKLLYLIQNDNLYLNDIKNIPKVPLPQILAKEIEAVFDFAVQNQSVDKKLIKTYSDFLIRQKKYENSQKLIKTNDIISDSSFKVKLNHDDNNAFVNDLIEEQFDGIVVGNEYHLNETKNLNNHSKFEAKELKIKNDQITTTNYGVPDLKPKNPTLPLTDESQKTNATKNESYHFKHKNEVFTIINTCKNGLVNALKPLDRILYMQKHNLRALYAKGTLLIKIAELSVMEEKIKEEYLTKQKNYSMNKVPTIFISYSHNEKLIAEKISEMLKRNYMNVIIDSSIPAAMEISTFIDEAISKSDVTLLIVSKSSILSSWVGLEIVGSFYRNKFDKKKKIIFCYTDDIFFDRKLVVEIASNIDNQINEINKGIQEQTEMLMDTRNLNNEKTRYFNLRNNIDEIIRYFKESISVDIRGDKLEANFEKILDSIKN